MGVRDSLELAWNDWQGSAAFDRLDTEDSWAARWARAYVEFAAGEKRAWLRSHGLSFLPAVGWAERGGLRADGHGNSVPRFHVTWGTGPGVVAPFVRHAVEAASDGELTFHHRHRVDALLTEGGAVTGVRGSLLADDHSPRGAATSRQLLDPSAGPLIGLKLHVLTRKTLGGIQTDLDSRALDHDGTPIPGLYAAGEVAGFGGGVHGYNALEGTFLGGCLFTGRQAGRAAAEAVGS